MQRIDAIMWALGVILSAGLLWGCGPSPEEEAVFNTQPVRSPEESTGEALFAENCATCHGSSGAGNPMMLGKAVNFTDPTWQKMFTDEQIAHIIKNGQGVMPAFETTFNDQELETLVQHIRSLKKAKKP